MILKKIVQLITRCYFYIFDRTILYPLLCLLQKKFNIRFMNLGYDERDHLLPKVFKTHTIADECRANIALYEKTLSMCPSYNKLNGLKLLEVGCGHGGGLTWIRRYTL